MIRIYTSYIVPDDFGKYDVSITYISLLSSIVFFDIWNAIMKHYFEEHTENNQNKIITNGLLIFTTSLLIYTMFFVIMQSIIIFEFRGLIYLYGLLIAIQNLFGYFVRMKQLNRIFVYSGILSSLCNSIIVLLLLIIFDFGYESLYIGFVVAVLIQIVYQNFYIKVSTFINKKYIDWKIIKKLVIYSLPLAINSAAYWLLTGFGKIYVSYSLGDQYNGYLAIASKFSIFLTLVSTAFTMAWQELSYKKYELNESNRIFYNQFSKYFMEILAFFTIIIVILVYFIYPYMVAESYNQSKILIPIFLISSIFSILSTFFGTILLTYKLSSWISISTTFAAITSVLINLLFMQKYGVIIFPIALLVSWIANSLVRIIIINKVMRFNPISIRFLIFITASTISLFLFDKGSSYLMVIAGIMAIVLGIVLYFREIRVIYFWFRKGDFSGK